MNYEFEDIEALVSFWRDKAQRLQKRAELTGPKAAIALKSEAAAIEYCADMLARTKFRSNP